MKEDKKTEGTKTRERRKYKYDPVIEGVREITSCNRTNFNAMAVEKYIETHIDEAGVIDQNNMIEIIEDIKEYKINNPVSPTSPKKEKEVSAITL